MKYIISAIAYLLPSLALAQAAVSGASDTAPVGSATTGTAATTAATAPGMESLLVQLGVIFVIFYFLLIRPQQKKYKMHAQMVSAIQKGDKVVTTAGMVGVVKNIAATEKFADIEIAPGVQITVLKSSINDLADKPVLVAATKTKAVKATKTVKAVKAKSKK